MIDSSSYTKGKVAAVLFVVTVTAFLFVFCATRWGAGTTPDSVAYVQAAREFAAGHGLMVNDQNGELAPLQWFPPMYPLVLASGHWIHADPLTVARYFCAAFFAASVLLAIALTWMTTRWVPAALIAGVLTLLSPAVFYIYTSAWSEPLFVVFTLLGLMLLGVYLRQQKIVYMLGSVVFIAAAMVTRYAGFMLAPFGMLLILLLADSRWWRRLADALLFGVLCFLPLILWLASRQGTGRGFNFELVTGKNLGRMITSWTYWIIPTENVLVHAAVALLVAACVGTVLWRGLRHPRLTLAQIRQHPGGYQLAIMVLFPIAFVGSMIVIVCTMEPVHLNKRILFPIYIPSLVAIVTAGATVYRRWPASERRGRLARASVLVCSAALVLSFAGRTAFQAYNVYKTGFGYSSARWRKSATIQWIKQLPPSVPIYTNAPDAVYLLTRRPCRSLPPVAQIHEKDAFAEAMATDLLERGGCIVFFMSVDRKRMPRPKDLKEINANYQIARTFRDSRIVTLERTPSTAPATRPGVRDRKD